MKKQQYEKELAGLKDRIKLLEELLEKESDSKNEGYPKIGEDFCYIEVGDLQGNAVAVFEHWRGTPGDIFRWNFCHGSTDGDKVEWTIKHIELVNEIKKYTRPFKDGEYNASYYKDCIGRYIRIEKSGRWERANEYDYFDSEEKAEEVVDSLGEDYVAKFLFKPIDGDYKAVMDWLAEQEEMQ